MGGGKEAEVDYNCRGNFLITTISIGDRNGHLSVSDNVGLFVMGKDSRTIKVVSRKSSYANFSNPTLSLSCPTGKTYQPLPRSSPYSES